jgi:hypothetical protein
VLKPVRFPACALGDLRSGIRFLVLPPPDFRVVAAPRPGVASRVASQPASRSAPRDFTVPRADSISCAAKIFHRLVSISSSSLLIPTSSMPIQDFTAGVLAPCGFFLSCIGSGP